MQKYIVVMGSPIAGYRFFGPFTSEDVAYYWAGSMWEDETYWVVPLDAVLAK